MELPAYHAPAWGSVLQATWERGFSFIKRAGTVILVSSVILWFLQGYGFVGGVLGLALVSMIRDARKGKGCGGDCSHCRGCR